MVMSWGEFTAQPNGTRVANFGFDQCVALANQFHLDVLGGKFVPVASAFQWWTQYAQLGMLRDTYTQAGQPVAGAVAIWKGGRYDGVHGHIGVVTSVNTNGTYNTMEQNAGTWRYLGRYTRDMANVLGFLHPRNNPAGGQPQPVQKEDDDMAMTMWRNKADGMVIAGSIETGYWYHMPSPGHANLAIARGFVKNQGWIDLEPHEFTWLMQMLNEAKAVSQGAQGDPAVIANAVADEAARRMRD